MLIHKTNAKALVAAEDKRSVRRNPFADVIQFTKDRVYYTNGFSLYVSPLSSTTVDEFPDTPHPPCQKTPTQVPLAAVQDALKGMPKSVPFPVLENIFIGDAGDKELALYTKGAFGDNTTITEKADVMYPAVEALVKGLPDPNAFLTFSVKELERMVKVMKALKAESVRFSYNMDKPELVRVEPVDSDCDEFFGVVAQVEDK
jgi:hypothetical protein